MVKKLKFSLICDDYPCKSIDDLQEHFSVIDILGHYKSGKLLKWLESREYSQLEAVTKICCENNDEIVAELAKIFDVEADIEDIREELKQETIAEENIVSAVQCEELPKVKNEYVPPIYDSKVILRNYFDGYNKCVNALLNSGLEIQPIKETIDSIADNYMNIFRKNYRVVFYSLLNSKKYLAIMCLLMNEKTRSIYIHNNEIVHLDFYNSNHYRRKHFSNQAPPYSEVDLCSPEDTKVMLSILAHTIYRFNSADFIKILGSDNVKTINVNCTLDVRDFTELLPSGNKYMVLGCEPHNGFDHHYLRFCPKKEEIIEGISSLVITDGIRIVTRWSEQVKSPKKVIYLEV